MESGSRSGKELSPETVSVEVTDEVADQEVTETRRVEMRFYKRKPFQRKGRLTHRVIGFNPRSWY